MKTLKRKQDETMPPVEVWRKPRPSQEPGSPTYASKVQCLHSVAKSKTVKGRLAASTLR